MACIANTIVEYHQGKHFQLNINKQSKIQDYDKISIRLSFKEIATYVIDDGISFFQTEAMNTLMGYPDSIFNDTRLSELYEKVSIQIYM